jgi:hypothetical protein
MARTRKPGICRVCGCTDYEACDGGCEWVEPDLCSQCLGLAKRIRAVVETPPPRKGLSQAVLVITERPGGIGLRSHGQGAAKQLADLLAELAVRLRGIPAER